MGDDILGKAKAIVGEVRHLPPGEQTARIADLCAADGELRRLVEQLLARDETQLTVVSLGGADGGDDPRRTEIFTPGASSRPPETADSAFALREGSLFGGYRIVRLLGRGGFGSVWEAESIDTGRFVALKVMNRAYARDSETLARFEREARLAASFNHPNCVCVFDAGEIEGVPAIAMEIVRGETLQERIDRDGPLECPEAVDAILALADGLEAARRAGVIHRDVKPSNCFVDHRDAVKIGDFGLSRSFEGDAGLTRTGAFLGTPVYSSPEQIRGRALDHRSDIYSLGATLYALLTGKPPFQGGGPGEVMARILGEEPVPFEERGVEVPRGLRRVIAKLLEKNPDKRLSSYGRVKQALLPYSSRGLTAAGLGTRLLAYMIDVAITSALFVLGYTLASPAGFGVWTGSPQLPPPVVFAGIAGVFLYFSLFEGFLGRTPGKMLFGLFVRRRDGSRAPWRGILMRAGVFVLLNDIDPLLEQALKLSGVPVDSAAFHVIRTLVGLAGDLCVLGTMRRWNGWAGMHELISGTRVSTVSASRSERPAGERRRPTAGCAPATGTVGPYALREQVWSAGGESLFVGRDETLDREVWVHAYGDPSSAPPLEELFRVKPTRLPWLQGRREEGRCWDAYGMADGLPFREYLAAKGPLPWERLRSLLIDLANELESRAGAESASAAARGIDQVWIDGDGRCRLLDFAIRPSAEPAGAGDAPPWWDRFLRRFAGAALTGQGEGEVEQREILAILPGRAVGVIGRLWGDGSEGAPFTSPAALREELERIPSQAGRSLPVRRLQMNLIAFAPYTLFLIGILTAMVFQLSSKPFWQREIGRASKYAARMEELESGDLPPAEAEAERVAIEKLLAYSWLMYERTGTERPETGDRERALIEESARRRGAVSDAEVREARRRLGRLPLQRMADILRFFADLALITAAALAPFAMLAAFALRGSLLFALFGLELRGRTGRKVGRGTTLLRAALVWGPALLYWLVPVWLHWSEIRESPIFAEAPATVEQAETGLPPDSQPSAQASVRIMLGLDDLAPKLHPWDAVRWLVLGALVAGFAYSFVRPGRGLPDLVVGTRIVPK